MSLLEGDALRDALTSDAAIGSRLVVAPLLDEAQVGPASIDLRLGTHFQVLRRTREAGLDLGEQPQHVLEGVQERVDIPFGQKLWLQPNQFVLGATLEFLSIPGHLGAYVLGRSSWGRVGLIVATAIMVHPGFKGSLTLELVNEGDSPIALYPGTRIAQLAVHHLTADTSAPYGHGEAKYRAPLGPETPRLLSERSEVERLKQVGARLRQTRT